MTQKRAEVVVIGGGLGGVAAALAAARAGRSVILTEEFDWLGGQLTSQAVPPDEHSWIEQFGATASYRALRNGIRDYYRRHYPLTARSRAWHDLNPGAGWVSRLCHEPRVALAVIEEMLAPHRGSGRLTVLQPYRPISADVDGDRVVGVTVAHRDTGEVIDLTAPYIVDATETGELLPLTGAEYVTGFESREETGEPSAPAKAQPLNMQAVSVCFALDHVSGGQDGDHTIEKPKDYDFWRDYQPSFWGDKLLSWRSPHPRTLEIVERNFTPNPDDDPLSVNADQRLNPGDGNMWTFRRIAARRNFVDGAYASDITLVNWPMIDYFEGPVIDVPDAATHLARARDLSYSVLYWLQTEAGFPGLRLRGDITGSADGLAQAPYIRESRRIKAQYTVVEQDLSLAVRQKSKSYNDSVGVGMYRIDLHPSTGGDSYIDVGSCPFEIPLGAMIPRRLENLLPGGKNIGTTHITNGSYRLHPVEWNVGEVAGELAGFCLTRGVPPRAVRNNPGLLADFQDAVRASIPDTVVEQYLTARARNHQINRLMIEWVADGTISHLVLSEDDTAPVGLARAERVQLEALAVELGVTDRVEIFPGADEVDALLVGRVIATGTAPTYRLDYAGVSAENWTAALEGIPFAENIRRHVKAIGGSVVSGDGSGDTDIVLAVNTPSAAGADRAADLDAFVARIGALRASGQEVIVVDPLIVNKADHELVARMQARLDLLTLLSYSGWNTGGNALGLALGHGTARWAYLSRSANGFGLPELRAPAAAHASYLLYRLVKDDPWKNIIQVDAYAHARAQGWNPLALTAEQKAYFDGWLAERLVPLTQKYFADHFAGHKVLLGSRGVSTFNATLSTLDTVKVELPWDRLFEVILEPRITLAG